MLKRAVLHACRAMGTMPEKDIKKGRLLKKYRNYGYALILPLLLFLVMQIPDSGIAGKTTGQILQSTETEGGKGEAYIVGETESEKSESGKGGISATEKLKLQEPRLFDIRHMEDADFRAVIVSDLHYSDHMVAAISALAPMQNRIEAILQTFLSEVIDIRPDVLIICGDNTNSGDDGSQKKLAEILRRVQDAGIPVVMVSGNHDYTKNTKSQYEKNFSGILFPKLQEGESYIVARDRESLSYAAVIKDYRLLAMDDTYAGDGIGGKYAESTMQWLENQLETAETLKQRVIFITHHNLLPNGSTADSPGYRVENPELLPMLKKHGVKLGLTGHRHSQEIVEGYGMHEIVSAFPQSYPFYFGVLKVTGQSALYEAQSIDFERYGKPYKARMVSEEYEKAFREAMGGESVADYLLKSQGLQGEEFAGAQNLVNRFMDYYSRGILAEHREEILNDPYYPLTERALRDSNYGPWMTYVLQNLTTISDRLAFSF